MADLKGKKVLVGICGGVSAYKIGYLVSSLVQAGADVRVIFTPSAYNFVGPSTFSAITGNKVFDDSDFFSSSDGINALHIYLAGWADVYVIAPATANTIAKLANGMADNLLTAVALAIKAPIMVVPAMNSNMWANPATVENVDKLRKRGFIIVGPQEGRLACGEVGSGRMTEPDEIYESILQVLSK